MLGKVTRINVLALVLIPLEKLFFVRDDMPVYKRPPYQTEPRILPQRRARPDNQQWKIPPSEWPLVLARIDQGESLRKVAQDYNAS